MKFFQLKEYYSGDNLIKNKERFAALSSKLASIYNKHNPYWFSASGRTEICGNHTDHNQGKVLAASIQLDSVAAAVSSDDFIIEIHSEGFGQIKVDLKNLEPLDSEKDTSAALIRGITAYLKNHSFSYGGFKACISSEVFSGSGLSSSASFEGLIGSIQNCFYNSGKIDHITLAQAGKFAENKYFGKPCGLMDQLACIHGGILEIDFKEPKTPLIKKLNYSFEDQSYGMMIMDTGQGHENLTSEYASIPREMKIIAQYFGKKNLREVDEGLFLNSIGELKKLNQDRAVLRAIHFFSENKRVTQLSKSLKNNNIQNSLKIIQQSSDSSFKFLQNIYPHDSVNLQPLSLALAICQQFFDIKNRGVCRVHGGGFAGTILILVHHEDQIQLTELLEKVFGSNCCTVLNIRKHGLITFQGE